MREAEESEAILEFVPEVVLSRDVRLRFESARFGGSMAALRAIDALREVHKAG